MNNLVPIEFKNQRIMTTSVIAESYGTTTDHIKKNFNNNKDKYKEGKHYFLLQGEELREFKSKVQNLDLASNINKLYLWTEKGALLHAKSLNTDEAWEVYDRLVETYFRVKEVVQAPKKLTALQQLKLQSDALLEVSEKQQQLEEKVEDMESNFPLFNIECEELQKLVKKVGTTALGGYGSRAYKDNSLRQKVYKDIQHQLTREFGIGSYKAIKRCQLSLAKEIVQAYRIPTFLQDQVTALNNQLEMEEF